MVTVGIAGGTGAGKTTLARALAGSLADEGVTIVYQDSYYKDRGHLAFPERAKLNYDCPEAFEIDLLASQLRMLKSGVAIERPVYSFEQHARADSTVRVEPQNVIVLEGILVLYWQELRELLDLKVYVDAPADIRFIRRLQRDIEQRGRVVGDTVTQYLETVRPMHAAFIEPTREFADFVVPGDSEYGETAGMVVSTVQEVLCRDRMGTRCGL